MLEAFWDIETRRLIPTDTKGVFHRSSFSSQCVYYAKNFRAAVWNEVAKGLIVHLLFSSFFVYSFEPWKERRATLHRGLRVANDLVINQVRVYPERVYLNNVESKFWFVRSFVSRNHFQNFASIATENVPQVRTKKCKTRSFIWKGNLKYLRTSKHFNSDIAFAVIATSMNESVHGFNNNRNGGVETSFQMVNSDEFDSFFIRKIWISLCDFLIQCWVIYSTNCNLPLTFNVQLLRHKVCKRAKCIVWNYLCRCIRNQLYCKRNHC